MVSPPQALAPQTSVPSVPSYARTFLIGFSCFIALCGHKIIEIMSQPEPQRRVCVSWNVEEIHELLDFFILNRSKLTGNGNFQQPVYSAAAAHVGTDKHSQAFASKWNALKRTFSSIETYRNRSGCHWDNENGASITSASEIADWNVHIKTTSGKGIIPFRNKGWMYYDKMQQIYPQDGAQGSFVFDPAADPHQVTADDIPPLPAAADCTLTSTFALSFSMDQLYQIGQGIVSSEPVVQTRAINDAISILHSVSPLGGRPESSMGTKRSFSEMSAVGQHASASPSFPPSKRPSPASSHVEGKLSGRHSASIASSKVPSTSASKRSKIITDSKMSTSIALTHMSASILHLSDVLKEVISSSAPVVPSLTPSSSKPSPIVDHLLAAMNHVNADTELPFEVRSHVTKVIMTDEMFCKVYAVATDPMIRHRLAMDAYEQVQVKEPQQSTSGATPFDHHTPCI